MKRTPLSVHSSVWIIDVGRWSSVVCRWRLAMDQVHHALCTSQRFRGMFITAGLPQSSQTAATAKTGGGASSFSRRCSWRTSVAVKIETNGAGAAAFSTLDQAHHADDFKSKFAYRLDRLNCRRSRSADVIHDHDARTLLSKAFDPLSRAMLLLGFADEKAVNLAAGHGHGYHHGIGPHG